MTGQNAPAHLSAAQRLRLYGLTADHGATVVWEMTPDQAVATANCMDAAAIAAITSGERVAAQAAVRERRAFARGVFAGSVTNFVTIAYLFFR